jgi:hypothetical protein
LRQANPSWLLEPALTAALRWTRDRPTLEKLIDGSAEEAAALEARLERP